jgi:alanine racemase
MTARVDLGAIRSTLDVIRSLAGDRTVMAGLKGNAYGHELMPGARCPADAGVRGRWPARMFPDLTVGS